METKIQENTTMKLPIKLLITVTLLLLLVSTASAVGAVPEKEEVVYVNLDGNGDPHTTYIVNTFDVTEPTDFVDYGSYSSVRNMLTLYPVILENDTVSISASSPGRFYYEGTSISADIPWKIAIQYLMDGKPYSASEIAGKTGHLDIHINITENPRMPHNEYSENYAIQLTASFDTAFCSNIAAPNTTIATVGTNKQLTYIAMPGSEANIHFSMDVHDFRMEAITINGIRMNIRVEVNASVYEEKTNALISGIEELDANMKNLTNGTKELYYGSMDLSSGAWQVSSGANRIADALGELFAPVMQFRQYMDDILNWLITLDNAVLEALFPTDTYVISKDNFTEVFIRILDEQRGNPKVHLVSWMNTTMNDYYSVYVPVMEDYTLNISQLVNGSRTLANGASNLGVGADTLMLGADKIYNGSSELANGTATLRNETQNLNSDIAGMIDELLAKINNDDYIPVSFASEKNGEITSLQFSMRTENIERVQQMTAIQNDTATVDPRNLSLFEKILWLFGFTG